MELYKVGTIARLRCHCMGNLTTTLGVCYETYILDGREGASFIFENGNYDGFSPEEQKLMLEKVRDTDFTYNFKNVMALSRDFDRGVFNEVLGIDPARKLNE